MSSRKYRMFNTALSAIMRYFRIIVIFAVIFIILSGIYRVDSNEVAVVLRFGRLVGDSYEEQVKKPGLHFAFPFIVDEVIKIPVDKVQTLTVITHYGTGTTISPDIKINGYVITGDSNIVLVKTEVKYTVGDPVDYALYQSNAEQLVKGVVSGEVTAIAAGMDVDSILTTGKAELVSQVKSRSQKLLDEVNCGINITNVEFTEVTPPAETQTYFEKVNTALVQKETSIQNARENASVIRLSAEAEAQALVQNARANQSQALTLARREISEFDGLYEQYVQNPDAVMDGVFRLRVTNVLSQMGTVVVVPEAEGNPTVILP